MEKSSGKSSDDDNDNKSRQRQPDENPLMALVDAATSLIDPDTHTDDKPLSSSKNVLSKKISFAEHLMSVLDDSANSEYLAWMPDGKAFSIVDPKRFLHDAMARLFNIRNMSSFVRKLGRWGFRRVHEKQTRNSDIFTHPDFRRGDYQRCRNIRPVGKKTAPVLPFTPPLQHATKQPQYTPTASSLYDSTDRRGTHSLPYSTSLTYDHISSKIASDVVHAALETLRLDELCAQQSAFLKAGPRTSQGTTLPTPVVASATRSVPPSADLLYHKRSWLHNAGAFC